MIKTHIVFVLDSSGSMSSLKDETITQINKQINHIKTSQSKNMMTSISLYSFNESVSTIYEKISVYDAKDISSKDYNPGGLSALNDSVSSILDKINSDKEDESVLFWILSDGKDTSSNTINEDLSNKIDKLQNTGKWTFTYTAANQDIDKACKSLGIPRGNAIKYDAHPLGMKTIFEIQSKSIGYFLTARSYGTKATRGFFGSDT